MWPGPLWESDVDSAADVDSATDADSVDDADSRPLMRNSAPHLGASPTPIAVRLYRPASHCSGDARSTHIVTGGTAGAADRPDGYTLTRASVPRSVRISA